MKKDINKRDAVVDGWLIDKNARKFVNPCPRYLRGLSLEQKVKVIEKNLASSTRTFPQIAP